jgi:hypothetical protein
MRPDNSVVTIAGRFEAALMDIDEPGLAGPELLPVRLARAAARVLEVDAVGISMVDAAQQLVPLGASSTEAATAERMQFTAGEGPCMTAQDTRQPVFAPEDELRRRWPVFSELMIGATRTARSSRYRCWPRWPGRARWTSSSRARTTSPTWRSSRRWPWVNW